MIHVALYEPEIPPNTGNIMRLCVNSGAQLHLIKPLGFDLDNKQLKRAGLDYREYANVSTYDSLQELINKLEPSRMLAVTTKGKRTYSDFDYRSGDLVLFGPETRGLPEELLKKIPADSKLRIPMLKESRSLNLSNAVAVIVYEAWRQLEFINGE